MKLSELLNNIKTVQVTGNAELKEIDNLTIDSRTVTKNSIFFAIKGFKTDGHLFIPEVINKKVAAVVLQNNESVLDQLFIHANCVKILVEDSRKALARFSNLFYGEPSQKLILLGITGTKGKTTTAFYIKNIFQTTGNKTGLIGTIANYIGEQEIKTMLTTPQPHELNSLFSKMLNDGCTHCVMEVSSHALDLHRVDNLNFNTAVFTNITSDHMDYHKTFDQYLNSKKILFDMIGKENKAVINIDDTSAKKILKDTKAKVYYYGIDANADFKISDVEYTLDGTTFKIEHENKVYNLSTCLVGHFNAYNATSAFAVAVINGVSPENAVMGIKSTPQVPGRFEVVSRKNKKVIIDYSHTSDSLKQALKAVHHIVKDERPIYTVFGCGGDRDRTKRPIMGDIASSMSKKVYVTSDNPRTEEPFKIID